MPAHAIDQYKHVVTSRSIVGVIYIASTVLFLTFSNIVVPCAPPKLCLVIIKDQNRCKSVRHLLRISCSVDYHIVRNFRGAKFSRTDLIAKFH